MTTIYGDGYEAATEPGPDVEVLSIDGTWSRRDYPTAVPMLHSIYRRPIKLRVGETYRCRNGAIVDVVELSDNKTDMYPYKTKTIKEYEYRSYKANGVWSKIEETPNDIIEHIPKQPKEKPMNEQTITVENVSVPDARRYASLEIPKCRVELSFDQVQEAYDKMVKAKSENEIKVGDYILSSDGIIMKAKTIDNNMFISGCRGFVAGVSSAKKLHPTPEQKAWLDSLIGGAE